MLSLYMVSATLGLSKLAGAGSQLLLQAFGRIKVIGDEPANTDYDPGPSGRPLAALRFDLVPVEGGLRPRVRFLAALRAKITSAHRSVRRLGSEPQLPNHGLNRRCAGCGWFPS